MADKKETQGGKDVRRFEETQWLDVKLTEDEMKKESRELADAINKRGELEDRLSSVKTQIKAEVTELEGRIKRSAILVNQGKELRLIKVDITLDFQKGRRFEVRKDSGEQINERVLSTDEKQMRLEI